VKITINKESSVPIRDQLIEQVALQIASGLLKQKEKLPSIRALADRLGIHYSTVTAAYNHLAEAGLLEIRQGSGVRVAGRSALTNQANSGNQLDLLFNEFLAKAADQGFSHKDLSETLGRFGKRPSIKRILAVDANTDFHPIILNELKPNFSLPVEACTVDQLKEQNREDALIVTSLYHLSAFQQMITDWTRMVVCNIEPASTEIGAVADLPAGSLVVLVSASETMMRIASKLIAATRGEEVPVRTIHPKDTAELTHTMRHADLILCDTTGEKDVLPISDKKKVHFFRLYSQSTIDLMKDRLAKWG
jgi:DNA-binding transcriptional regulator YhcF (GntR family)